MRVVPAFVRTFLSQLLSVVSQLLCVTVFVRCTTVFVRTVVIACVRFIAGFVHAVCSLYVSCPSPCARLQLTLATVLMNLHTQAANVVTIPPLP